MVKNSLEKNKTSNLTCLASKNAVSSAKDNFQFFPEINSKVNIQKGTSPLNYLSTKQKNA
jgi:hypothetical protein